MILGENIRRLLVSPNLLERSEVASMRWSEIDKGEWTIPADQSKNGKTHLVHLSKQAMDIREMSRPDNLLTAGIVGE